MRLPSQCKLPKRSRVLFLFLVCKRALHRPCFPPIPRSWGRVQKDGPLPFPYVAAFLTHIGHSPLRCLPWCYILTIFGRLFHGRPGMWLCLPRKFSAKLATMPLALPIFGCESVCLLAWLLIEYGVREHRRPLPFFPTMSLANIRGFASIYFFYATSPFQPLKNFAHFPWDPPPLWL